jgi:hypothetical protein
MEVPLALNGINWHYSGHLLLGGGKSRMPTWGTLRHMPRPLGFHIKTVLCKAGSLTENLVGDRGNSSW